MQYPFRTTPFPHQQEEFHHSRSLAVRALFWEQGTGKSKEVIDETSWLAMHGEVDGWLIIAPNGVHRNWVVEEIPTHMPEVLLERVAMHWYSGDQHHTRAHQAAVDRVLRHTPGELAVLAMSYDSLMTEHGRQTARAFLTSRRCMYSLDESRRVKSPTAKRTKRVLASGIYAPYRRILNGTPVANGPFDIYSQILFLDPDFWDRHGVSSFAGFKTMFANFKPIKVAGGRIITVVESYKNLDLLSKWLSEISSRKTKEEVLDLPPKLFTRRSFEMTEVQRKIYNELRDDFITFLDSGDEVTAPLAITRLLRMQQVTCGYLPPDASGVLVDISDKNPRLELLKELCEDLPHKAIIWARFRRDIDKITEHLGEKAVRYDGGTTDEQRADAIERFQRGDAQFFVGNAQAAGEGLTLHAAQTVIYYSQDYNLGNRLQSEDRAHRIGQKHPVNYIDIVASRTVDENIAAALVKKLDVACQVTGDSLRTWLA